MGIIFLPGVCVLVSQSVSNTLRPCGTVAQQGSSVHGILYARILAVVDCHSHLQGTFPTQGLNPGLLHCRRIFPKGKQNSIGKLHQLEC